MDFGIALALSAAAGGRMTETGLSLGTPHYMSPEQATAEKEITGRSDIYSLGSVLYEMLTGNPPHTGATAQQIIMKIITEPAQAVTALRKSVPPNVAAAVAKAIEKLPADRFESAKAFAEALSDPAFTTGAMAASGAGGGTRAGISRRGFALVATAAVIATGVALAGWLRPVPEPDVLRVSLALADSQGLVSRVSARVLAISPDGKRLVYVGVGAQPGTSRLWLRPLDQLRGTPIPGTDGGYNPAFSPDGQKLAFTAGGPRKLQVVSLAGGPATMLTDSLVDAGGVSWGDDGYLYYDAHFTGDGLARIPENGGKPEPISMPDSANGEVWHSNPSVIPGTSSVLITIARRSASSNGAGRTGGTGSTVFDVGVLDTRTRRHKVLVRGAMGTYAASGHLVFATEDGTLMAVAYEVGAQAIRGTPVPIGAGLSNRGTARMDVTVSRTGALAYVAGLSGRGVRELVWMDRAGQVTRVDSTFTFPGGQPSGYALSPEGGRVALMKGANPRGALWIRGMSGASTKLAEVAANPSWTPDGKAVLFDTPPGFVQAPTDGSALPALVRGGAIRGSAPRYSPDGEWIIFVRDGDILGFHPKGDTTPVALVSGLAIEWRASFSPDGKWLLYQSDETGRTEIFVRPFPDTQRAKWQLSIDGGSFARWARDGKSITFLDAANSTLMEVPVKGSAALSAGSPRAVAPMTFTGGASIYAEPHPDGRRFLLSRPVTSATDRADEIVLVQNVFAVLRAATRK